MTKVGVWGALALCACVCGGAEVKVDFTRAVGPVKPMHAVGQPPLLSLVDHQLFRYLKEAGTPYSRLHDVGNGLCGGREHLVNVTSVFPDFDADETKPESYDFLFTDKLIDALVRNGVEPWFRLGVSIENYCALRAYDILPPKDYAKWARVCEYIIRHYTEGWADGFRHRITHWEIWNEPDNRKDPVENQQWRGTFDQFCELYAVAATHLKAKFPHLKIGGYGSCGYRLLSTPPAQRDKDHYHRVRCIADFLAFAKARKLPLDFFSYHSYLAPSDTVSHVAIARRQLDDAGYAAAELSLNEWLPNPKHAKLGTAQQAAEVCAEMLGLQGTALDSAMIYDARCDIGAFSPLFNPLTYGPHKAYYAFKAFNELYRRKRAVAVVAQDAPYRLWAAAAGTPEDGAVVLANTTEEPIPLALDLGGGKVTSCLLTDAAHTYEPVPMVGQVPPHSFVVVFASTLAPTVLPLRAEGWRSLNPLGGAFTNGTYSCDFPGVMGMEVSAVAPVASNVTFSATVTPKGTGGTGFKTAAVALRESPARYWHLALVEGPKPDRARFIELNEMRDDQWLAQNDLKVELDEGRGGWKFGEDYRLTISLDGGMVEGKVTDARGATLFRRRFRLKPGAVGCGRPTIKCYSLQSIFANAEATWKDALPQGSAADGSANAPASAAVPGQRFFRSEKGADGRWAFVSPSGEWMFLAGCGSVNPHGDHNFKLGYAPYGRNVLAKHGTVEKWAEATTARLREWGFNFVVATGNAVETNFPHARILAIGQQMAEVGGDFDILPGDGGPCTAFPNVFSPKWEPFCRYVAERRCRPCRDDPLTVGYFIDNELSWWGDARKFRTPPSRGLFDAAAQKPQGHTARLALERFLRERGCARIEDATDELRRGFVRLCAERYFSVAAKAIREADPNHLVLGCRFAGIPSSDPVVWEECGKHCDVVSINTYPVADLIRGEVMNGSHASARPIAEGFAKVHEKSGKPLMITEWSFSALDSGVPCLYGAGQRFLTQKERAKATELFARTMYALPFVSGYIFFKWSDQPKFGRVSEKSENTNYGLVNERDEPYREMVATLSAIQNDPAKWRNAPPPKGEAPEYRPADVRAGADAAGDAAAVGFAKDGDGAFALTNGLLAIRGRVGGEKLDLNGVGVYSPMVRMVVGGSYQWPIAARIVKAEGAVRNGVGVLDLTFGGQHGGRTFEVENRLYLPAGKRHGYVEHVAVRNTAGTDFALDQVFFRLMPKDARRASASKDGVLEPPQEGQPTPIPPQLWRPWQSGLWVLPDGYCAAAAPREAEVSVHFWKGEAKDALHADACWPLGKPLTLAVGAERRFARRPFVIVSADHGDASAWRRIYGSFQ